MTICKLCEEKPAIENSHIIPEFMYKPVYNSKHKFIPFSTDFCESLNLEQKGFREPLLCNACEGLFAKFENNGAKFLKSINSIVPLAEVEHGKLYKISGYDDFKRMIVSIFWRMSISKLEMFAGYDLNGYENKIRQKLKTGDRFLTDEFPVLISHLNRENEISDDLIVTFKTPGKILDYTVQSFISYGLLYDLILTDKELNKKIKNIIDLESLDPVNKDVIYIKKQDLAELQRNQRIVDFNKEHNKRAKNYYGL